MDSTGSTMDFFGHQERARRASGRLVWLFAAAVIGITLCIYAAAKALLIATDTSHAGLVDWPVLAVVAAATFAVVGGAMAFKTAQLRSGGGTVAELLGGREVSVDTKDPKERMLRNVVEEMAIASGVPVPAIYVLDGERQVNAFAAGWSPADAAVAVTRGALETFTRDELQGVVAHEFSHVFHGDMRLNIRLMGTLFGIVCIAVVGRIVVRALAHGGRGSRDKKGGAGAVIVFGIALIVIGYVGVFFARLIQAAVSRQREYLADASAVQYTRNPRGIGLALAKIAGIGARLENAHTEEASHMLFADGMRRFAGGALATHPPLDRRIERILPGFLREARSAGSFVDAVEATPLPPQFAGATGRVSALAGAAAPPPAGLRPGELLASVGDPQPAHVTAARRLLDELPLDLAVAAREPQRAPALVLALLLDRDARQRDRQLQGLGDQAALAYEVQAASRAILAIDRDQRLPLLELTLPALRQLPMAERRALRQRARALALADDVLSPFEFALLKTLERHLRIDDERPPRPRARPEPLVRYGREAAHVLSVIAHAGAPDDPARAAVAFARGRSALAMPADLEPLPPAQCSLQQLEASIAALAAVSPFGKRNLLQACAEVAADDGVLAADEVDLIRALGELWDCPVPLAATSAAPGGPAQARPPAPPTPPGTGGVPRVTGS